MRRRTGACTVTAGRWVPLLSYGNHRCWRRGYCCCRKGCTSTAGRRGYRCCRPGGTATAGLGGGLLHLLQPLHHRGLPPPGRCVLTLQGGQSRPLCRRQRCAPLALLQPQMLPLGDRVPCLRGGPRLLQLPPSCAMAACHSPSTACSSTCSAGASCRVAVSRTKAEGCLLASASASSHRFSASASWPATSACASCSLAASRTGPTTAPRCAPAGALPNTHRYRDAERSEKAWVG